jgi:hypothetical protein
VSGGCDVIVIGGSTVPGMGLKLRLERSLRDAAGVVRDRGRGDDGDDLERMIFAEAGRDEPIDILIVETPAFFDHRFCQSRQRSELTILRQTALADGLDIRRIDPLLERQSGMERDGPSARIGHRVGEQNGLDLRFRETAAVRVSEQTDEALIRTGEVAIAPAMFGIMPKAACNCCSAGLERSGADSIV